MASSKLRVKMFSLGHNFGITTLLQNQLRLPSLLGSQRRTLFSAEAIGLDGYEKQRNRVKQQFGGMEEKFRAKMSEFALPDSKNMIFTEDLKNMVHMVESKPDDMQLVLKMMQRFNQQNRHLRFGNYVFGPVIMRMYHHLNQPRAALDAFKDPELEGLFDQLGSYQILCNLLFVNKMYKEILELFESIKEKQVQGTKYPRNVLILVFAALYKLNSVESYEYALKTLKDMKDVGSEPVRRVITYTCGLAMKQNAPQVALEILSTAKQSNYVTVRNLKIWGLAELNRPDDILPMLRYSLEFDNPQSQSERKSSICPDVLEKVAASVQRMANKEVSSEFENIKKSLVESKKISEETLEEILEVEIERPQRSLEGGFNRQNMLERSFQIGRSINLRPRQNPTFEREKRSLYSD